MSNKKYYWLKLQKDFFKRHDIRIIESMANGKDYILFYLKLLCESTSHEGSLRFSETIPYSEEMLSTITNTNIDIVRSAIKIFAELHMMEVLEDGTLFMNEVEKMIGCETSVAERVRKHRAKQKVLQSNNVKQICNIEIEKEIDIEKELEIDIDKDKDKEKKTYKSLVSRYTQNSDLISALNDYVDMRKKTKGFTVRALELALKKLDTLAFDDYTKIEIVNQSILNSWKTFYPLKTNNNQNSNKQSNRAF